MKKELLYFYILIFSALFFSCGLPSYNVVEPPENIIETTTDVSFTANSDPDVYGYEIYYKLYDSSDTGTIVTDKKGFEINNVNSTFQPATQLLATLGFNRLTKLDSGEPKTNESRYPLYLTNSEINAGDILKITIGSGSNTISINGTPLAEPLRNTLDDTNSFFKSFYDVILLTDNDNNNLNNNTNISISLAAYSAASVALITHYDSYPVFLGTLDLTIVPKL